MAAINVMMTDSRMLFFFTVLIRFVLFKERTGYPNSAVNAG